MAIDRTSKFAFAQLHPTANVKTAAHFLAALVKAVPYKIHTVLTDNGVQFGDSIWSETLVSSTQRESPGLELWP